MRVKECLGSCVGVEQAFRHAIKEQCPEGAQLRFIQQDIAVQCVANPSLDSCNGIESAGMCNVRCFTGPRRNCTRPRHGDQRLRILRKRDDRIACQQERIQTLPCRIGKASYLIDEVGEASIE